MSTWYRIDTKIKLKFTQDNIEKILLKGNDIGLTYFGETFKDILDAKQAAEIIFKNYYSSDDDLYPAVRTKYEDTHFKLWIDPRDDSNIEVSMHDFCPKWLKEYTLDFARYIRLLLKFLSGFTILELIADTDLE